MARINNRILFLVNHDVAIYNFRLEIVEKLLQEGYEVHISSPYGERIDDLISIGVKYHKIVIDRHGINPITEIKLLRYYEILIKKIKPIIIFGFTIKPNIYGAIVARKAKIPFVANITGLGTAVENSGMLQKITLALYKIGLKKAQKVFFQNEDNMNFMLNRKIINGDYDLLPGSGVNLIRFPLQEYPCVKDGIIRFAFISRIMKEKGIEQYLEAACVIKRKYPNVEFHICGFCETEYVGKLEEYQKRNIVIYHGMIRDMEEFLRDIHCVVHPSYYPEGISNILLEACATGKPIITTDRAGCREVIDDGINGYMISQKNTKELISAIEKMIQLRNEDRKEMGLNGRNKVKKEFDRNIVVDAYIKEIEKIGKCEQHDIKYRFKRSFAKID